MHLHTSIPSTSGSSGGWISKNLQPGMTFKRNCDWDEFYTITELQYHPSRGDEKIIFHIQNKNGKTVLAYDFNELIRTVKSGDMVFHSDQAPVMIPVKETSNERMSFIEALQALP